MNGGGKSGGGRGGGQYRNPCLTMHQPWASLLIHGIKRIEGRSWPSPLTGRLWIHAASKVPDPETIKQMEEFYREIYSVDGVTDIKFPEHYPVSRLLGCVEIVGCLKKEEVGRWEEVPKSVRFEGLTDFCWLCEKPQKLIVPFEMRGYQGVYNLENKIHEAAVRGLIAIKGPLPVKFPLPDPQNSLSLKPGSLLLSNTKASEVEKSASVSAAIAGARAAAAQFSRKDESRSAIKEQQHETIKNHATVDADRPNKTGYNLRKRSQDEKQELSTERKLTSAGTRDTISKQSETRNLTPHGSTKMSNVKDINFSAVWDRDVKMIFCELCLKEVELGNRPTTHFNKEGWQNLMKNFKARTGREYTKLQLKNKWDQIKKDWKLWKELKRGSTGFGWDPIRRTIDASDEWWTEKLQVVPNAKKFRFCGIDPEMEVMLDKMFTGVVATSEHVWAPTSTIPPIVSDTENSQSNEINAEEVEVNMEPESSRGKRLAVHPPKRSKVGAGFLRDQISQLVSTCSSWTSTPATTNTGRSSMAETLKLLDSIPEVYDDMTLYISCVKLLEDPLKREVFLLLDPVRRLPYLRSYF